MGCQKDLKSEFHTQQHLFVLHAFRNLSVISGLLHIFHCLAVHLNLQTMNVTSKHTHQGARIGYGTLLSVREVARPDFLLHSI